MEDIKLKINKEEKKELTESFPELPEHLIMTTTPNAVQESAQSVFKKSEEELLAMRLELSNVPSSESLMKLYELQAKGRAYYERSAELFRVFLRISSEVTLVKQQAEFKYQEVYQKVLFYARQHMAEDLRNTKSGTEREIMITALIPLSLREEKLNWDIVESKVRVNYNIIKSYQEQFRSVREDILVQLSIIKNLILLGGIKVDPEAMRFFRIIESSYTPTDSDRREKAEDASVDEVPLSEGVMQI